MFKNPSVDGVFNYFLSNDIKQYYYIKAVHSKWIILLLKERNIFLVYVNDFIADKNVVTKIINNSTGLQRI